MASIYNSFLLSSSTVPCPPFRPSSRLDRSIVELQLKKPSFLIPQNNEHSSIRSLPSQQYSLSQESISRLEMVDRNPFYKHSQVHAKWDLPQRGRFYSKGGRREVQEQEDGVEQYRDVFSALMDQHLAREFDPKPEPCPRPEVVQPYKESRIGQILAEVAKMHIPSTEQSRKENKTNAQYASFQQNYSSNYPSNNPNYSSEYVPSQNHGAYGQFRDKRPSEEEGRASPIFRETPTIIQELGEEHLGHKLVSSQVYEFPSEDPVTYWVRKQSDAPAPQAAAVPQSIRVRGDTFLLVPV